MKHIARPISLFLTLMFLFSCSDEDCDFKLPCGPRPTEGTLTVKVNYNDENPTVPIAIYQGQFEDDNLYMIDTLRGQEKVEYTLPVDRYYSVTATYIKNNNTITALDGDRITLNEDEDDCLGICYSVNDAKVNLKLKY